MHVPLLLQGCCCVKISQGPASCTHTTTNGHAYGTREHAAHPKPRNPALGWSELKRRLLLLLLLLLAVACHHDAQQHQHVWTAWRLPEKTGGACLLPDALNSVTARDVRSCVDQVLSAINHLDVQNLVANLCVCVTKSDE